MSIFICISLIISFLLDYFLFNIISFNYIFPMFFLVTNILLYKYLNKNNMFIFIFLIIIYSSIFLNNIILGFILFIIIFYLNKLDIYMNDYFRVLVLISIYDLLLYLIIVIFNGLDFYIYQYIFKVINNIYINIIYIFLYKLVLKKRYLNTLY